MEIKNEDIIFGSIILLLLGIWYLTLILFDYPLLSIIILWTGMIIISLTYVQVYKKSNRDLKILRRRFFISAIPIYPMLLYYIYKLVIDGNLPQEQKYLPFFIVMSMLVLNAIVLYIYEVRKQVVK
ncbi:hypothetical protein AYK24_04480 [Thermoplasmatales archaeon SG8-52-4]|nr:MAG: hypothetical protein AYK24_04480 [Thermoplasmatales archaeon SG8-52-4]